VREMQIYKKHIKKHKNYTESEGGPGGCRFSNGESLPPYGEVGVQISLDHSSRPTRPNRYYDGYHSYCRLILTI